MLDAKACAMASIYCETKNNYICAVILRRSKLRDITSDHDLGLRRFQTNARTEAESSVGRPSVKRHLYSVAHVYEELARSTEDNW
jgi:hypothetical protein